MKKFLKGVVEWKTSACMIFTAAMFFYLFFCPQEMFQILSFYFHVYTIINYLPPTFKETF